MEVASGMGNRFLVVFVACLPWFLDSELCTSVAYGGPHEVFLSEIGVGVPLKNEQESNPKPEEKWRDGGH